MQFARKLYQEQDSDSQLLYQELILYDIIFLQVYCVTSVIKILNIRESGLSANKLDNFYILFSLICW